VDSVEIKTVDWAGMETFGTRYSWEAAALAVCILGVHPTTREQLGNKTRRTATKTV
jgi:hypothetical protein